MLTRHSLSLSLSHTHTHTHTHAHKSEAEPFIQQHHGVIPTEILSNIVGSVPGLGCRVFGIMRLESFVRPEESPSKLTSYPSIAASILDRPRKESDSLQLEPDCSGSWLRRQTRSISFSLGWDLFLGKSSSAKSPEKCQSRLLVGPRRRL